MVDIVNYLVWGVRAGKKKYFFSNQRNCLQRVFLFRQICFALYIRILSTGPWGANGIVYQVNLINLTYSSSKRNEFQPNQLKQTITMYMAMWRWLSQSELKVPEETPSMVPRVGRPSARAWWLKKEGLELTHWPERMAPSFPLDNRMLTQ